MRGAQVREGRRRQALGLVGLAYTLRPAGVLCLAQERRQGPEVLFQLAGLFCAVEADSEDSGQQV